MLDKAYQDEGKTSPRLSMAFAQVMLGKTEVSEFSPLQFLVNTLNSAAYHGVAFPFLVELARDPGVRKSLYTPLLQGHQGRKNQPGARDGAQRRRERCAPIGEVEPRSRSGCGAGRTAGLAEFAGPHLN